MDVTSSTSGPEPVEDPQPGLDLGAMRREYAGPETGSDEGFLEADVAADWLTQFERWFAGAVAAGLPEPNAMVLATAAADGRPSARTVLLKLVDSRGFVFVTNYESRKGTELSANPHASLVFPWHAMRRQVIVVGDVSRATEEESAAYFATRPRGSQIGAWTSPQSRVLGSRAELDEREADTVRRFSDMAEIPLPPHWGGFRVRPHTVEFWQGRASRLHDRLRFRRVGEPDAWIVERLAP